MPKFTVNSGSITDYEVNASTPEVAMILAIEMQKEPIRLGFLIGSLKEGDKPEQEILMQTETVLKNMGCKRKNK